jgi:hypothetical protein
MRGSTRSACTNCKESLNGKPFTFKTTIICEKCHKIVSHLVAKTKREYEYYMEIYFETLRVAIVRGELNFPVLPKEKTMPAGEFKRAFQNLGGQLANLAKTTTSESGMHPLQSNPAGGPGEVPGGGRTPAIPWRRDIREMPAVQEDGITGDRNSKR